MIFDLETDPNEFRDLAMLGTHQAEIDRLYGFWGKWQRRLAQRVTRSDVDIRAMRGRPIRRGILPFLIDGSEFPDEFTVKYRGSAPKTVNSTHPVELEEA